MNNFLQCLLYTLQGAIVGIGAILPGISGGVLCVVFGVYEPMMEFLSNPIKCFKKHLKILILRLWIKKRLYMIIH